MKKFGLFLVACLLIFDAFGGVPQSNLTGKTICIDPGHGGTATTDHYRVGKAGEREEWINLRVGLLLQKILEEKGARVVMTRRDDSFIPLPDRAKMATDAKADLFVSIHHNATADSSVNFPIIYFHGNVSENLAGVNFARILASSLIKKMYNGHSPVSIVSDFTVFADAGASVLRNTYGIPAVLAEASFFTNSDEESRLKTTAYNTKEAEAYAMAIEAFFREPAPKILAKNSIVPQITPFKGLQEAERMSPVAKLWLQDFEEAKRLFTSGDSVSLRKSYELFTRSARSFPDSYVAAKCHEHRAVLLKKLGKNTEAADESRRRREFYVDTTGL